MYELQKIQSHKLEMSGVFLYFVHKFGKQKFKGFDSISGQSTFSHLVVYDELLQFEDNQF